MPVNPDPDFDIGGSSMAKGNVEIAALSRKKLFDPLMYIADAPSQIVLDTKLWYKLHLYQ